MRAQKMITNVGLHWHFNQVLSEVMVMEFTDSDEGRKIYIKSQGNRVVTKPVTRGGISLHIYS
jgi:hypothetical protein